MELSDDAKLNFLRDLMVRTRFDIMQDKESLTRLFYAKLITVGGALSLVPTEAGALAVLFLPFIVIWIDHMHKKRVLEVFARWRHSAEQCVPAARKLEGFWADDEFRFFEEEVVRDKDALIREEAWSRGWLTLAAFVLSAPVFVIVTHRFLGTSLSYGISLMAAWAVVVFEVLWAAFLSSEKFQDTYPYKSWSIPIGLGIAVGIFALLSVVGFDVVELMSRVFPAVDKGTPADGKVWHL